MYVIRASKVDGKVLPIFLFLCMALVRTVCPVKHAMQRRVFKVSSAVHEVTQKLTSLRPAVTSHMHVLHP